MRDELRTEHLTWARLGAEQYKRYKGEENTVTALENAPYRGRTS